MPIVIASAGIAVATSQAQVTAFLADLSNRPRILTENYSAVRVEDDHVLSYHFSAGGRERDYRLASTLEDATLTESDELSSFVNTWTVTPSADARGSVITLTASWNGAGGIGGIFEAMFAPRGLRRIYARVLAGLADALGA